MKNSFTNKKIWQAAALGLTLTQAGHSRPYAVSAGVEAGTGYIEHAYSSTWTVAGGGKSGYNFSKQTLFPGIRLNISTPIMNNCTLGLTTSARYYGRNISGNHGSVGAHAFTYKGSHNSRFEFGVRAGYIMDHFEIYGKLSGLMTEIECEASDYTFSTKQKSYRGGYSLGLGIERSLGSNGVTLGGLVEYDQYRPYKGSLKNVNGSVGRFEVQPNSLNLAATLSVKLDFLSSN